MKRYILFLGLIQFLFLIHGNTSGQQVDTIVFQPGPANGMDAAFRTDQPNQPYGDGYDFIANAWTAQGNFFIMRSLIRFDLTPIPTNATVLEAILKLTTNLNTGHYQMDSGANASYFLRVLTDWDENQVTWNTQPAASMNNPVIVPQSTSNTETYYLDLTNHVQDMVSHPESNFGWLFRQQTEERYRCLAFASSDNPMASWRPKLTVIYTICPAPVASFYTSIHQFEVSFHETSPNATSWSWDFGDGTTSNDQNPVHTYLASGTYQVCLTASDSCGSSIKCQEVEINCPLPHVDFSFTLDYPDVTFLDESSPPIVLSRLWNFGDGTTSNLQNPVHTYSAPGSYLVCLTLADSCGSSFKCKTVDVTCPGPKVQFSYFLDYTEVHFIDSGTSPIISSRYWDFGDSTYSTAHDPVHTYTSGLYVYYVCFTATDSCGSGSVCDSVYVEPPMKPHFTSESNLTNDLEVDFTGQAKGAASWDWSFGDGEHSTLRNPSHLYSDYGNYQVCITVTNPLGTNSSCDSLLVIRKEQANRIDPGTAYPNPTDGKLKIKFIIDIPNVNIFLFNNMGMLIHQYDFTAVHADSPLLIDLSGYPKGVYLIKIRTNNTNRTEKIVLN